ncbi:caspase recruitment domain-containing protein 14 [Lampris incognitus]|uniref:caspase recruitment domain-containing protein 14 n=1 Tax=Lampris incognitus TaxID=2546036 RepID=UPI0024B54F67|nr:caspase recruitment domain-containing protein 14 [Lampris incognitus]
MAGECVPEGPDLKEMGEEALWELINDNRHRISLGVRPCMLIPYLRQARVLTEMDEDEILSCHNLTNRSMRTSFMLDLLRTQGRNGAIALLESLMIHYPTLYTQVTGQRPSTEPSKFSGLIKYSELTEYLVRAVTGMQKELQEARHEASHLSMRCASFESEIGQMMEQEEKTRCFQADYEHMQRQLTTAHQEIAKLKDEKCDLYGRYTAAIEEKSAVNIHCRDLNLQIYQLQTELLKAQKETDFQRRHSLRCASPVETQQLREEVSLLRCKLLVAEKFTPACEDILAQDLAEAMDGRMELVKQLRCYQEDNQCLVREKEELLDEKECLNLQVQHLTLDCDMYKQRGTVIQGQLRELQAERDQAYLSRDEAQARIAQSLAEKDALRSQLVELQERLFTVQARRDCEVKQAPRLHSPSGNSTDGLSKTSAPPFLMRSRPQAIRITDRTLTISFQAEALLSQLMVVGGNKTGVFVHQVMEGTTAHTVGISPGAQIVEVKYEQKQRALRMVLQDSTLEEALWALDQVRGFCHLSLRPSQDAYENLLQQLQNGEVSSGDSFYIRVNMSLPGSTSGALAVSCNEILHVTNTRPTSTKGSWQCCHVHLCQLLDLQSGTVPNYYRAQRLLIRAIEDMCFQTNTQKGERMVTQDKQKAVRIVSSGRQGRNPLWLSVEDHKNEGTEADDVSVPRGCVTLMPYTLVTPHYPPICRPILLLPSILGRILDKKLASWQGFQLCEPEVLSCSEHAAKLQRSEVLEECEQGGNLCFTLQSVEKVMKTGTHCVLPLGLDCVRRLHRAEIFPIIIFIAQSACSARKLRSKLHRHRRSEEQLLACSRSEEPLLDKLPCLYRSVAPDTWCDSGSLLTNLRTIIWEEQKKIVWVEPDLW